MSTAGEPSIMSSPSGGVKKPANKAKKNKKNPVRRIIQQEVRRRESSMTPSSPASSITPPTNKKACPKCKGTDISEGACQDCGFVFDDSNIVSEITFGEAANGAAVAIGTRLAADQGGIRPTGRTQAFQRLPGVGSQEARERNLREAKMTLQEYTFRLGIPIETADTAAQIYKMAMANNFTQGRRKPTVCAVCMYAACREKENNNIMLIDLADIVKVDVFLLGRSYKELLKQLPSTKERTQPIMLEDLIFRFASKLEFLHDTHKVALSAIRIARRMREDYITPGRRPSGVCGAAIILAARAHNYRRTVREVVYIAKVTMATLQERMQEFANVPAAQLTVKEFQEGQLPEATFDPPVLYRQSKEWLEKHPTKKRKVRAIAQATDPDNSNKRQRIESSTSASGTPAPSTLVDKDGFVVPPTPQQTQLAAASEPEPASKQQASKRPVRDAHETALIMTGLQSAGVDVDDVDALAREFRPEDEIDEEDDEESTGDAEAEVEASSETAMAIAQGIHIPGMKVKVKPKAAGKAAGENGNSEEGAPNGQKKPKLVIDEAWELDEANLENEIGAHLADPAVLGNAAAALAQEALATAPQPSQRSTTPAPQVAASPAPPVDTSETASGSAAPPVVTNPLDDPIIHEHEFEDDLEVKYCLLHEDDRKKKEEIWLNQNKDWLRKKQQKFFESKMAAANGLVKPKRNRAKKPRIGEGQSGPAESAEEAAQNMLKARKVSNRLDLSKLTGNLFDLSNKETSSGNASAAATVAPSVVEDAGDNERQAPAEPNTAPVVEEASAGEVEEVDEEAEEVEQEYQEETYDEAVEDDGGFDPFGDE
ncbi:transcription factor iiib-like protein [Cladorrhinum sp. PSN259]|nr:transcription factor iiib-like protein [Cladorrhinum sp. PSN259]